MLLFCVLRVWFGFFNIKIQQNAQTAQDSLIEYAVQNINLVFSD